MGHLVDFDGSANDRIIPPVLLDSQCDDPAIREQARKLIEQLSPNAKLAPKRDANDSRSLPFPRGATDGGQKRSDDSSENSDAVARVEKNFPPTRALQDLMNRLIQQRDRQPNASSNEANSDKPSKSGVQQKSDAATSGQQRIETERRRPATRDDETNSTVGRTADESAANLSAHRNDANRLPRNSEADNQSIQRPSKRMTGATVSVPPMPTDPSRSRSTTTSSNDDPFASGTFEGNSMGGETGSRSIELPSEQNANRDRPSPKTARSPKAVTNPGEGPKPPQVDVRSELEEKGFAQTLRQIVEQAREENRAESQASSAASVTDKGEGSGSSKGLESSFVRMLDGIREDLVRDANKPSPPPPPPAGGAIPQPPPPAPAPPSAAGKVMKSVGDFFSQMAAAPNAAPVPARPSPAESPSGASDSQEAGSRSTGTLLVLLVALGLAWYFMPQVVTSIHQRSLPGFHTGVGAISSSDIRTREDIVRAFHRYALESDTSVPMWWTHREVERQVAEKTPTLQPSIQSRSNLYEQARYLPEDANFTRDQIGIARRELDIVCRANHLG